MRPPDPGGLVASLCRRARFTAGETQEEFARRVGLSRSSIANIETGRQAVEMDTWLPVLLDLGILSLAASTDPVEGDMQSRLNRSLQALDASIDVLVAARQWVSSASS